MTSQRQFSPGEVLGGRYQVEGALGHGGYGVVLRAAQLGLGQAVAIKVLQADLVADEGAVKRFLREAELVRRLEHPHTIKLLDVGQTDDGAPFLVFELLAGRTLEAALRHEAPFAAARVGRVSTQVLKSLMDAHARQVVHRDLKPANVFLCDFPGEPDFVKVLDFGIGKALDGTRLGFTTLTQVGSVFGTPSYMAPECIRGEGVTVAADLYALGLVMAEMLSGQVIARGASVIAVCAAHLAEEPHALPPAVLGSPLGGVIRRAVEKAPARRYGSAAEMLAAVEAALQAGAPASAAWSAPAAAAGPALAAPPPRPDTTGGRHVFMVAFGAALTFAVAISAVAVVTTIAWRSRREAPAVARQVVIPQPVPIVVPRDPLAAPRPPSPPPIPATEPAAAPGWSAELEPAVVEAALRRRGYSVTRNSEPNDANCVSLLYGVIAVSPPAAGFVTTACCTNATQRELRHAFLSATGAPTRTVGDTCVVAVTLGDGRDNPAAVELLDALAPAGPARAAGPSTDPERP